MIKLIYLIVLETILFHGLFYQGSDKFLIKWKHSLLQWEQLIKNYTIACLGVVL